MDKRKIVKHFYKIKYENKVNYAYIIMKNKNLYEVKIFTNKKSNIFSKRFIGTYYKNYLLIYMYYKDVLTYCTKLKGSELKMVKALYG